MKALAKFVVLASLVFGCLIFLAATFQAGRASVECNDQDSKSELCDPKTKYPKINPWLERLALPLSATLATFFGAAIGLVKTKPRQNSNIPYLLRWGALVDAERDWLAILQTVAGFIYLIGVTVAFYFLFIDTGNQGGATDSPFTHTLIKSQGNAFVGLLIGAFALALGVDPPPPTGVDAQRPTRDY